MKRAHQLVLAVTVPATVALGTVLTPGAPAQAATFAPGTPRPVVVAKLTPAGGTSSPRQARLAVAAPALCNEAGNNQIAMNRHASCARKRYTYTVVQLPNGTVLGTGDIETLHWEILNATARKWTDTVELELTNATGVVFSEPNLADVVMHCGTCNGSAPSPPFLLEDGVPVTHEFTIDSPGKKTDDTSQTPEFEVTNAMVMTGPASAELPTLFARCDSEKLGLSNAPGCVNSEVKPEFGFPGSLKAIAANILNGQSKAPNWGVKGSGHPLTRTTDGALIGKNRAAARAECKKKPKPKGLKDPSCDEYPFASTKQGAAANKNATVAWVSLKDENSVQGGLLSKFYREKRVINDDDFWVAVS